MSRTENNFREAVQTILAEQGIEEAKKFLAARGRDADEYLADNFVGIEKTVENTDEIVESIRYNSRGDEPLDPIEIEEDNVEEVKEKKTFMERVFGTFAV